MPRLAELSGIAKLVASGLLALGLLLPALAAVTGDPYLVKLGTRILVFGLAAAALDLALGVGGMVSFGHAAFLGLGAYVVGILFQHAFEGRPFLGLPPTQSLLVQAPVAMLLGAGFALVTGLVALRTRGVAFIMITLAFAQMLYYLFVSLKTYNGEDGIALWSRSHAHGLLDTGSDVQLYYLCLGCLVLFLLFAVRLHRSPFGRIVRGAKDNERRMAALGFPVFRYRLAAYAISGAVTALAGVLLANAAWFVGPSFLSWRVSGELIVMVVMGGMGTLVGPVLGAAAFLLLEELLPAAMSVLGPELAERWRLVLGPILVLIALYARGGLASLVLRPARAKPAEAAARVPAHG